MSIVVLDDVRNELPGLVLSPTTMPNETQVTGFIGNIESEVRAQLEACVAPWPADGTSAAAYLKRTILEGVRWLTLRAKFALSSSASQSPDIDRAYKAYMDRIGDICDIARSITNTVDTQAGQAPARRIPTVAPTDLQPILSGTFNEWTQAVDIVDQQRQSIRYTGRRPWPLR